MDIPLKTENLTKISIKLGGGKDRTAVDGLDIEVSEGTIFGFLGPNGAGKTTTIKMVLDFLKPNQRPRACLREHPFGRKPRLARTSAFFPEQPYFHKFLKPVEIVSAHARLAGMGDSELGKRVGSAMERAGISGYADTPISKLSKGLAQRVGHRPAIVADPKVYSMNPQSRTRSQSAGTPPGDLLIELRNEGTTVFLSSHLLSEIENLCDVVAVFKTGKAGGMRAAG